MTIAKINSLLCVLSRAVERAFYYYNVRFLFYSISYCIDNEKSYNNPFCLYIALIANA